MDAIPVLAAIAGLFGTGAGEKKPFQYALLPDREKKPRDRTAQKQRRLRRQMRGVKLRQR